MRFYIVRAMVKKDLQEIWKDTESRNILLIVPTLLSGLVPAIVLLSLYFGVQKIAAMPAEGFMRLLLRFPLAFPETTITEKLFFLGLNFLIPTFFLMIPVLVGSTFGAASFAREKEQKTMESLLYTPLSLAELFFSKLIASFVPAYLITWGAFVIVGVVANVSGWLFWHRLVFPNGKWLLLIGWLVPTVTLLALTFIIWISAKVTTFRAAQQMSGVLVLPAILMLIGQAAGVFLVTSWQIALLGAICLGLSLVMIRLARIGFVPEKLL